MKIKVKDLEANPYRKMDTYPMDKAKVEALKTSIKEKTFWDNLLVRRHGSKYQLAYGHHRWQALKELGFKEIDVPVRDIDDATMVQIMAEENLNWTSAPAVLIQTVQTAKEFLDAELKKHNWDTLQGFLRGLFDGQRSFETTKGMGVGEEKLTKFLGGNWSVHKVRTALNILKDGEIDKEAVKIIPSMRQAEVFQKEVKQHKIPKPTQRKIARTIAKEELGYRQIPDLVAEHSTLPVKRELAKTKPLPMLDDVIKDVSAKMADIRITLKKVQKHLGNIQSGLVATTLNQEGGKLLVVMNEIFGKEIKNV